MRSLKEILAYAFGAKTVTPPFPDELALHYSAALMQSGRYESPEAAIAAAWWTVPHFYIERLNYQNKIAPMFFVPVLNGNAFEAANRGDPVNNSATAAVFTDEPEYTVSEGRAMHDVDPVDLPSGV